jgi:peptidoglycan/LPS O-acetylase OafA/YrhL
VTTDTLTIPSTVPTPAQAAPSPHLGRTGVVAGLSASVATVAVAAFARAIDVPLKVGGQSIPLLGFAQVTFIAAMIGTVLAVVLSHRAHRPQRTFVATTIALTILSIVPDVLADAQTATKFALALTHVVAATIVIPALASRLAD